MGGLYDAIFRRGRRPAPAAAVRAGGPADIYDGASDTGLRISLDARVTEVRLERPQDMRLPRILDALDPATHRGPHDSRVVARLDATGKREWTLFTFRGHEMPSVSAEAFLGKTYSEWRPEYDRLFDEAEARHATRCRMYNSYPGWP